MQRAHVECSQHALIKLLVTHCPVLVQTPALSACWGAIGVIGRTVHGVDFDKVIHAR